MSIDSDLHAGADAAAVLDDVTNPLDRSRRGAASAHGVVRARSARAWYRGDRAELVPVQAQRFTLARIAAVVRHEPLAGHEVACGRRR